MQATLKALYGCNLNMHANCMLTAPQPHNFRVQTRSEVIMQTSTSTDEWLQLMGEGRKKGNTFHNVT